MIDPASLADWTAAVILASLLGGVGIASMVILREELEGHAR